ncbi:MAG: carbohydrate ABC transporter permease [Thermomicrobiales bacterium]
MASTSLVLPQVTPRKKSLWQRFWRSDWYLHVIMILALLVTFIPIIWMISTSFKDRVGFAEAPASLIPANPTLVNYRYMLTAVENLPVYMRNSFILAIGTAVVQVFVASLAGYAFARMQFRGKNVILAMLIISIFIPRSGGLMALYELMSFLHLRNSLFGLILLFAANVPVPIFIMRQAFLSIPKEIEEAAILDGASWFRVYRQIALPLALGGMVIVATLAFITAWSDYLVTFTMIDLDSQMTISVGIQKVLASSYQSALTVQFRGALTGETADAAMLLTATLPVVIFYALLQRWFMRGLTEGAVKL